MIEQFKRVVAAFKAAPPAVIPANEVAWSESSMYVGKNWPKYNPDALLSRKGYAIYSRMMCDEQIKAVVRFKRDAITSRDWEFELDDESLSDDELDLRKAVFAKCIENMESPFSDSLNGIMSAMYNGFSMTEKVLGADLVHDGLTYVGIKKLKLRPCDTFYFHVDEFGNIDKLTQKYDSKEQEVDIERMIHFVQNPDYDDHYGRSELRECYRAWFSKDMVIKFQNIHLERFAAGFVWAQPIAGKTLIAGSQEYISLQQVMSNLQGTSSIILPSGLELHIEHPATTDAFERAISQHDKSIAKCLLVPNLMGISEQGSTGSYAQSQTQLEAFLWTLDADATRLESVLNSQLFKELGDLNFGDGNYPRFKFKPVSDVRKLEIVKIWLQLVTAGAVQATDVDEAYIRDALEMPKKAVIDGDAPDLILNGAQVTALTGIVAQVGAGTLSPEAAKALITAVFPITEEQAGAMVDSAKVEPPVVDLNAPQVGADGKPIVPAVDPNAKPDPKLGTDGKPLPDETIVGKMNISISAFSRAMKRVDFAVIANKADNSIQDSVHELAVINSAAVARLVSVAEELKLGTADGDPNDMQKIQYTASEMSALKSAVTKGLKDSWAIGETHAKRELAKAQFGRQFWNEDQPRAENGQWGEGGGSNGGQSNKTPVPMTYLSMDSYTDKTIDVANAPLAEVLKCYNSLFEQSDSGGAFPGSKAWKSAQKYTEQLRELVSARPEIEAYRSAWQQGNLEERLKEINPWNLSRNTAFAVNDLALQDLATAYLKQKGYTLAGDISAATQKTIRNILMEGIKVSKTAEETKRAIYKALEADGMLTEEAVVEALGAQTVKNASARIDTAIRTTSFEAINEARYSFFSDPALDGFVEALEYSAILDDRTTEICSQLDSQTFGIDDEVWSTFRPPNHFNCRSILIPVTVRDTWTESDPPSVLPQKGFGFSRPAHKHDSTNAQLLQSISDNQIAFTAAISNMNSYRSPNVEVKAGDVHVTLPEGCITLEATINTPEIKITQPEIVVNVPKPDAAIINVHPAPVELTLPDRKTTTTVNRDKQGNIISTHQIETNKG